MDVVCEQLLSVKLDGGKKAKLALIIFAALILTAIVAFARFIFSAFIFLAFLALVGIWFGAYKLACRLFVEYEYIMTNGDLDIDMIINKSKRKRLTTVNCKEIEKISKYNADARNQNAIVCCDLQNSEPFLVLARNSKNETVKLIMSPDERMAEAIKKFIPRIIQKDAFQ